MPVLTTTATSIEATAVEGLVGGKDVNVINSVTRTTVKKLEGQTSPGSLTLNDLLITGVKIGASFLPYSSIGNEIYSGVTHAPIAAGPVGKMVAHASTGREVLNGVGSFAEKRALPAAAEISGAGDALALALSPEVLVPVGIGLGSKRAADWAKTHQPDSVDKAIEKGAGNDGNGSLDAFAHLINVTLNPALHVAGAAARRVQQALQVEPDSAASDASGAIDSFHRLAAATKNVMGMGEKPSVLAGEPAGTPVQTPMQHVTTQTSSVGVQAASIPQDQSGLSNFKGSGRTPRHLLKVSTISASEQPDAKIALNLDAPAAAISGTEGWVCMSNTTVPQANISSLPAQNSDAAVMGQQVPKADRVAAQVPCI